MSKFEAIDRFKLTGMRDVPVAVRPKFDKLIRETFKYEMETPMSFAYEYGARWDEESEKFFMHTLEVYFLYWDGYELVADMLMFHA